MDRRRLLIATAAVLAAGTGLLIFNFLSGVGQSRPLAYRSVLVATQDIPANAVLTAQMIERRTRPIAQVEPDAIAVPESAVGKMALITIPAGATVTASKLSSPLGADALPLRLHVGMRAVSVSIDKVKGVGGLLHPGDLVDVIAVVGARGPQGAPSAATILRGVRVLAVGDTLEQTRQPVLQTGAYNTTATLEVSPAQADLLALADINATLRLALRSPRESRGSLAAESISFAAPPVARPAPARAAPAAAPRPAADPPHPPAVVVIEADQVVRPRR